ncbi:MAG: hypothetical protein ABSE86_29705 [Bryobacteraceae bacterium]|jgi:hypothetical protein
MNKTAPLEIRFQLRAKPCVTIDEPAERPGRGRLPQITRVLALAIHLEQLIRRGEAKDYADIGRLSCLCRERVSQIMRLNYLAPDIQVELLYLPPTPTGRYPISETAVRKIANILSWADQRREWAALKNRHHVG